jgi:hypothetical protein
LVIEFVAVVGSGEGWHEIAAIAPRSSCPAGSWIRYRNLSCGDDFEAVLGLGEVIMDEVLVLIREDSGQFFMNWHYTPKQREPKFFWTTHLSCARPFPIADLQLAEAFGKLLQIYGHDTILYQLESGRLIRRSDSARSLSTALKAVVAREKVKQHIANLGQTMRSVLEKAFEAARKHRKTA